MCGALFAAERLLRQIGEESVSQDFYQQTGSILCTDIKAKQFSCTECVRIADELVMNKIGII